MVDAVQICTVLVKALGAEGRTSSAERSCILVSRQPF